MASLCVAKFGGTSVATTARMKHVFEIVSKLKNEWDRVVVVTSAMSGVTNQLIEFTKAFSFVTNNREYDAVISSGEQVSAGLLALCLNSNGISAKSLNCWQVPMRTAGFFSSGYVSSVGLENILNCLEYGIIPVITGFQGLSLDDDIMTIGRGGSDASACAVAYALGADECFIYTDVDGVYSADPRVVLNSKRLEEISYDEMLELAHNGARVLQSRSVLIAKQCNVRLRVLSSFSDIGATKVTNKTIYIPKDKAIAGIAHNTNCSIIRVHENYEEFHKLISLIEKVDFINVVGGQFSFLTNKVDISNIKDKIENLSYEIDNDVGVVTLVGSGLKTESSILPEIFKITFKENINIKQISSSEISISIMVPLSQTEILLNLLHEKFFEYE